MEAEEGATSRDRNFCNAPFIVNNLPTGSKEVRKQILLLGFGARDKREAETEIFIRFGFYAKRSADSGESSISRVEVCYGEEAPSRHRNVRSTKGGGSDVTGGLG